MVLCMPSSVGSTTSDTRCLLRATRRVRMSEAIDDMAAYENLTDSVLWSILTSTAPELEPSRTLLRVRRSDCALLPATLFASRA